MNSDWAGKNEDYVLQISCMDKTSYVEQHDHLCDVSTQHVIAFGKYTCGMLNVLCPITNRRSVHYVTPVSKGKRYSVLFFKYYDQDML